MRLAGKRITRCALKNWHFACYLCYRAPMARSILIKLVVASVIGGAGLVTTQTQVGCGTSPVNPDGCKSIENARCRALPACPGYENLDVDACLRFYRDQCLHGLGTGTDPGQPRVDQCVRAIETAGACAAQARPECQVSAHTHVMNACDFLAQPQSIIPSECDFLAPPPPAPVVEPDSGTDAGDGGIITDV